MNYEFDYTFISIQNKKKSYLKRKLFKVGPPGFEPRKTEPKSVVLPLHHGPSPRKNVLFVGPPGFEPRKTEPKSVVLPLHHGPFSLRGTKLH